MNGFVDDQLRALLPVPVSASLEGNRTEILAWIDTAFNGGLAIPQNLAADLGLLEVSYVEAILADGKSVELPLGENGSTAIRSERSWPQACPRRSSVRRGWTRLKSHQGV